MNSRTLLGKLGKLFIHDLNGREHVKRFEMHVLDLWLDLRGGWHDRVDDDDGVRSLGEDVFHETQDTQEGDLFGTLASRQVVPTNHDPKHFRIQGVRQFTVLKTPQEIGDL